MPPCHHLYHTVPACVGPTTSFSLPTLPPSLECLASCICKIYFTDVPSILAVKALSHLLTLVNYLNKSSPCIINHLLQSCHRTTRFEKFNEKINYSMINESCIVFQEVDVSLTQMLATKEKFMASVLVNRAN